METAEQEKEHAKIFLKFLKHQYKIKKQEKGITTGLKYGKNKTSIITNENISFSLLNLTLTI